MHHRACLLSVIFGAASAVGFACTTAEGEQCAVGSEGCACTSGGTCDPGLDCLSNTCVDAAGSSSAAAESTGTATASGTASTTVSTSADTGDPTSGTTGAPDECLLEGGERLPLGFCLKTCTYDQLKPGNDLFEDCLPLGMRCIDGVMGDPDTCVPGTWTGECGSDADCGVGATCVTTTCEVAVCPYSYCHIDCVSDADCGPFRCVEECDGTSPLGYCHDAYGWPDGQAAPSSCG